MGVGGDFDAVVIGAGFGGLGAALQLAEAGARVCLLETLNYPGGCASTFTRQGYAFEAGATLFSGFGPGQLFDTLIRRHGIDVHVDLLDPMVRLRTPDSKLSIGPDRGSLRDQLIAYGTPEAALDQFMAKQKAVADALWPLFDDPDLLPPLSLGRVWSHILRSPCYAPLVPLLGRTLGQLVNRLGLGTASVFRAYLDAVCQITVQCSADEAEAPFALSTLDYYHRGTGHVRGGIGRLATGLTEALQRLGVEVQFSSRAKGLRRVEGHWLVDTRARSVRAPIVIANLLPQNLRGLLGAEAGDYRGLDRAASRVEAGWGAAMLYLVVAPPKGASQHALHLELVRDPKAPFTEGNHIFCSISGAEDEGRAPAGLRTITVSTHVPLERIRSAGQAEQAAYYSQVQADMRRTLGELAPEWVRDLRFEMTGSPRTFERFTGRFAGYVGGVPRRAGLHNYREIVTPSPAPGLFMVGDSVFPGQSTLATTLGGMKAASRALAQLSRGADRRALMLPAPAEAE